MIPINKAISNKNGEIQLFLDKNNIGAHSISRDNLPIDYGEYVTVETMRLDDFLKENNIKKVDIIKSDTQGHEAFVFEGMQNTIKNSAGLKIFLEFWPHGIRNCGSDPKEFLDELKKDFNVSIIGDKTKKDIDEILKTEDKWEYADILLVKK